jgi:flagellar basal body-associated protein FliL
MDGWTMVLVVIGLILLAGVGLWSAAGTYGWLDVRSAEDADDVRRNIEEYGPLVPGLKVNLLPEDERRVVLEARARAAAEKQEKDPAAH